ncbi:MAG: hypothetical protein WCG21_01725 [Eubacteriales bacterium]
MKMNIISRQLGLLSAVLAGCFLLSSCSLASLLGGNVKADIKKAVTSYLDVIQDGTFTDDKYESEFADDTAFADLKFKDEAVREIMDKGLTLIEYTIDATSGNVKKEEGACDVTITAIDVKKVLAGFEDGKLDADTLMAAVKDKKAPTKDYEITLDMTYNASDKVWLVADSTPLVEILGDPYTEITFGPAAGDPAALIETFFTALAAGDADTIDQISPYYDSTNFFDPDENVMKMAKDFYGKITYEIVGDPTLTDTTAEVNITMTLPDIVSIINDVSNDVNFMADLLKPYLLASINGEDTTESDAVAQKALSEKVIERLNASDVPMISVDSVFQLEVNQETGLWDLYEVPAELYDINPDPSTSDELYMEAAAQALNSLYQDGSIDQATYNQYMAELTGTTPTETTVAASSGSSSPAADILNAGWYDYSSDAFVTEYDSTVVDTIEYDILFNSSWPDLVLYYDYYNENGTVLIKSATATVEADGYSFYMPLDTGDGTLMPADIYLIYVYLEDGTPIAQESITVY